jgi:hypothetical protein
MESGRSWLCEINTASRPDMSAFSSRTRQGDSMRKVDAVPIESPCDQAVDVKIAMKQTHQSWFPIITSLVTRATTDRCYANKQEFPS